MSNASEKDHSNDTKIAVLENTNVHVVESLHRIERRLEIMESNFNSRIDRIDNRLWQLMFFTIAGFAGVLGLIAHAFKWI
jgi:hypothetical protein